MKKIIQIARLELSLLFYSPIAWLMLLILFIQMTMGFTPKLPELARGQTLNALTDKLFVNIEYAGVLSAVLDKLYLYIPLITMGIISRETSSGNIKLLYSSPVKLSHVVYGKFFSMMLYNLMIMAVICLFVVIGAIYIPHFDYPHILVALLAIYLMLNTFAAIGIFVSSLTTYQAVAAISTFVVLAFMNYIGRVGQGIDFIRDLTHSLSMPDRTARMMSGLLNSRDVIYYLVISGIFLALTITKLELERVSKTVLQQVMKYGLIVLVGLTITYISSRQQMIGYYDATATQQNTISKNTQEILKNMGDEPVEMTEYVNGLEDSYNQATPNKRIADIARWEPYLRFKPNIQMKWVYYYDSIPGITEQLKQQNFTFNHYVMFMSNLMKLDLRKFLTPAEIKQRINLEGENARVVMQLKYKDRTTFLRTFSPDSYFWPKEAETGAALKRLIVKAPKVVFATDGYQRSMDKIGDRDYKTLANTKLSRGSMVNQGFDVDSVSLENGEIPEGIAALVIADPKVAFSLRVIAKLQKYIDQGGNLMVAGEIGKQGIINPLLESLGVKMLDGTLVQQSKDYSNDLLMPNLAAGSVAMIPELQPYYLKKWIVSMPGASALSYDSNGPFTTHPLLMTNPESSWLKKGKLVLDSATAVFDVKAGDQKGSFPVALMLSRNRNNKEQRIMVSGDADFLSNAELARVNMTTVNGGFAQGIFKWFAYGEFPIDTSRPEPKDNATTLTRTSVKALQIIYYGVIPGIIFLMGMVILIRRKGK